MKSFLLFRHGAIGDLIHTLPLVQMLKRSSKHSQITYVLSADLVDLFQYAKGIDRVIPLKLKVSNLWSTARQIKTETSENYSHFIDLQPSWKSRLWAYLLGIPIYCPYYKNKQNPDQPAWQNFALSYFHPMDLNLTDFKPANHLPLFNLPRAKVSKNKIAFILGVGAQRSHRAWPLANWFQLFKLFTSGQFFQSPPEIILIGGPSEINLGQEFMHSLNQFKSKLELIPDLKTNSYTDSKYAKIPVHNLVGKLSLLETALALQECKIAIGADTGPTHLAGALGVYTIGLFGPTSALRHATFQGVQLNKAAACAQACNQKACVRKTLSCMEKLNPEEVCTYLNNSYSAV